MLACIHLSKRIDVLTEQLNNSKAITNDESKFLSHVETFFEKQGGKYTLYPRLIKYLYGIKLTRIKRDLIFFDITC